MAWLVLVLLVLIAVGNLIDFLLGPPGQRRLKDRLVDWYVRVAEGPWKGLVQASARTTGGFFNHLFGARIVSGRAIALAACGGAVLTGLVLVISFGRDLSFLKFITSERKILFWNSFNMCCIIGANAAVDAGTMVLTRLALRTIERTDKVERLTFVLLMQGILTYGSLAFVMALTESAMLIFSGGAFIGLQARAFQKLRMVWPLFLALFPRILRNPWSEGSSMSFGATNLLVFGSIAALPTLFSVFVLGTSWLARATRRFTQPALALLLQRLEGSPKGLFTTICVALSAVAGLVAALAKVLG